MIGAVSKNETKLTDTLANRSHSSQIVNAKSIDEVVHLAKIWQVKVFLVFGQKMCQIFMAGASDKDLQSIKSP